MDNENKLVKLKECQLDILIELDRVCNLLNLEYCLAFGTCLGAIRHKGLIPWDDDIDICMRVTDLEILHQNADLFRKPYFLQNHDTDPEFGLMLSRLRNSNTTLIERRETHRDINHGVFVDIYPLFNSPKDGFGAKKLVVVSMIYRLFLYGVPPQNRGVWMRAGSTVLLRLVPKGVHKKIIRKCYGLMRTQKHTGYLSYLHGNYPNIRFPENMIFPVQLVQFESLSIPVASDANSYLTILYGDYMQLPPEEKRVFHHDYVCIDTEHSYRNYKGSLYCKE